MSAHAIAYFAAVVMAVEALAMANPWALCMGLIFAVAGILLERKPI